MATINAEMKHAKASKAAVSPKKAPTPVSPKKAEAVVEAPVVVAAPAAKEEKVAKVMVPNPKYAKQLAMAGNYEITAWRVVARQEGHLKPNNPFQPIARQNSDSYKIIKTKADALAAEWRSIGGIPAEFRSSVTAPQYINKAELDAGKLKRKQIKATRKANAAEKVKLEEMKKEAEAKGEEFVAPKKRRASRKRKAEAAPTVEETKEEKMEESVDAATPAPKVKKPRAKRVKKEKEVEAKPDAPVVEAEVVPVVAAVVVPVPVVATEAPAAKKKRAPRAKKPKVKPVETTVEEKPFAPVTPQAKAAFLADAQAGGAEMEE